MLFLSVMWNRIAVPLRYRVGIFCFRRVDEHLTLTLRERVQGFQGKAGVWYHGSWMEGLTLHEDATISGRRVANLITGRHENPLKETVAALNSRTDRSPSWPSEYSIRDILGAWARTRPDDQVFGFCDDSGKETQQLTYANLENESLRLASYLCTEAKIPVGARVLLVYMPGLDFITAFFACLAAKIVPCIVAPLDPRQITQKIEPFEAIITSTEAKAILTDHTYHQVYMAGRVISPSTYGHKIGAPWIKTDGIAHEETINPESCNADDIAYLQFTSGSTANPKGVITTHGQLMRYLSSLVARFGTHQEDVGVVWVPQFHNIGLSGSILQAIYSGYKLILVSPLTFLKSPQVFLQCVSRYRATLTVMPNFGLNWILKKTTEEQRKAWNLASIRTFPIGAEPISAELLDRFTAAFAPSKLNPMVLMPGYGLTEMVGVIAAPGRRYFHADPQSLGMGSTVREGNLTLVGCGEPFRDIDLKIVNEQRQALPEDTVGEIWVTGPGKASGYWRDPELTKASFDARLDGSDTAYFRTGDLLHARWKNSRSLTAK